MNRLKFVVYALLAVGLWAGHVWLLSGSTGRAAEEQAIEALRHVEPAVARSVEASRVELLEYVAALASDAELAAVLAPPPAVEDPSLAPLATPPTAAERFEKARGRAQGLAPESRRAEILVAWKTGSELFLAKGAEAPVKEGVDAAALEAVGVEGGTVKALETEWSVRPVKFHGAAPTRLYVGLPERLPDLARIASEEGFLGMLLLRDGTAVASGGNEGQVLDKLLAQVPKDGTGAVVQRGTELKLGPLKFPLFTPGNTWGGQSPERAAVRQKVNGTPWEVVVMVEVAGLGEFANVQMLGLLGLLGLVLVTVGWTFLISNDGGNEGGISMPQPKAPPPPMGMRRNSGIEALSLSSLGGAAAAAPPPPEPSVIVSPAVAAASPALPASRKVTAEQPLVLPPELAAAPEASPDDFDLPFGTSPGVSSPAAIPAPADEFPFAAEPVPEPVPVVAPIPAPVRVAPPPPPPAPSAPPPPPPFDGGFGMADRLPLPAPRRAGDQETRPSIVVPTDLLKRVAAEEAAAAAAAAPPPAPVAAPESPPAADLSAAEALLEAAAAAVDDGPNPDDPEEVHWYEVFQELRAKKRECGEPDDGMPWAKFRGKLEATRNQVKQKQNCRGVRFAVQVKDGKAGLKALPIK
ncbi:MAG: hypothetical protein RL653_2860 [Pseudomonadota bacterium]